MKTPCDRRDAVRGLRRVEPGHPVHDRVAVDRRQPAAGDERREHRERDREPGDRDLQPGEPRAQRNRSDLLHRPDTRCVRRLVVCATGASRAAGRRIPYS